MSWRDAVKRMHRGVLETLGERLTLRTPGGARIADVPVSWDSDEFEDEADGSRYIRGFVSEADLPAAAGGFGKGWKIELPEGVFQVTSLDEKRADGIAFRARKED